QQVRREASQIKTRIGLAARLEAIEIKKAVHTVMDTIPTECAVDRRPDSRPSESGSLFDPLSADPEAVHQLRSNGKDQKGCLRGRDQRLQPVDGVWLHAAEHPLAPVQACQHPSEPFCALPDHREVALKGEILPKVHPLVEIVEDKARLAGGPRHWPWYHHTLRYFRLAQSGSSLEVGRCRRLRRVEPPGENPRLRRSSIEAGDSQHVAIAAVVASRPARRVNPAGLEPGLAVGQL